MPTKVSASRISYLPLLFRWMTAVAVIVLVMVVPARSRRRESEATAVNRRRGVGTCRIISASQVVTASIFPRGREIHPSPSVCGEHRSPTRQSLVSVQGSCHHRPVPSTHRVRSSGKRLE